MHAEVSVRRLPAASAHEKAASYCALLAAMKVAGYLSLAAALLLLMVACASPGAGSASDPATSRDAAPPSRTDTAVDRTKGFFQDLFAGMNDKPMITKLKPGAFVKSNEAIGDDRDVHEKRITHGIVALPIASAYANGVLDRLKAASSQTDIPGKVYLVANDQLDAGATADGNIFVSIGYLRSLDNEDQLAALLGHELSHVLLHHHDSSWFSRKQKELMSLFETGSYVRNTLEQGIAKDSSKAGSTTLTKGQQETLNRMDLLIKLNDRALHPAWGRKEEAEADRLGMDLMVKAGYSFSDGELPWLAKVAKWDAQQVEARAAIAAQRQQTVDALAAQGKFDQSAKTQIDGALKDVLDDAARSHDSGEKRLEEIDAYAVKAYADRVPVARPTVQRYQQLMQSREAKSTIDGYREAFVARNQVVNQEFMAALPVLRRLTSAPSPIANHALPNYLLFEAQRGIGKGADGEEALRRSFRAPEPTWEPFDSGASYFHAKGKRDSIIALGQTAFRDFGAAPSAYPRLVALYARNGLPDESKKMVAECRLKQPDMRAACDKAARP